MATDETIALRNSIGALIGALENLASTIDSGKITSQYPAVVNATEIKPEMDIRTLRSYHESISALSELRDDVERRYRAYINSD